MSDELPELDIQASIRQERRPPWDSLAFRAPSEVGENAGHGDREEEVELSALQDDRISTPESHQRARQQGWELGRFVGGETARCQFRNSPRPPALFLGTKRISICLSTASAMRRSIDRE